VWKEYRQVDILCTFRMGGGFTLYYRRAYDDGAFSVYIQTRLRGDAIKYSEWPPYNVRGQRRINVAYHIGLYIYLYARSIVFDFF